MNIRKRKIVIFSNNMGTAYYEILMLVGKQVGIAR